MKAILTSPIEGYNEDRNWIDGWGVGRLWGEEEEIPKGTIMEIIGHTMLFTPATQYHPGHYAPVVIVAYYNPSFWIDGDKVRRIAYLPSGMLKIIED